jgi:hypothetical protein
MISKKNNKFNLFVLILIVSSSFVSGLSPKYDVCVELTCPDPIGDPFNCHCTQHKYYDENYKETCTNENPCSSEGEIVNQIEFDKEEINKNDWVKKVSREEQEQENEDNWKKYNEYMNKSNEFNCAEMFKFEKSSTKFYLGDNITNYNYTIKIEELESRIIQLESQINSSSKNENVTTIIQENVKEISLFSKLWNKIRFNK